MQTLWNPAGYIRWLRQTYSQARAIADHPVHRGQGWRSVARWKRLTLGRRLIDGYPVVRYVEDAVLAWPRGATSVEICAKYGLGEFHDMAFCLHMLRPEDLFCDVGANAGVYTILASKAAGARCVAMEPVPRTFSLLMQNVWANEVADRVEARQCGVGRAPATLNFTASLWSFNHVVRQAGENTVAVPVEALDSILAGRVPRIIKIDVEGFEGEVIAGARETLSHPDCTVVIVELVGALKKFGTDRETVARQMRDFGYEAYWYDPDSRALVDVGTPAPMRWNQIFVRDLALVQERVASARRFRVHGALV